MGDKSADRFSDCHLICQPVNLPAEMEKVKSVHRFSDCHQICQPVNLLAEMWAVYLLADLLILTKSASQ